MCARHYSRKGATLWNNDQHVRLVLVFTAFLGQLLYCEFNECNAFNVNIT